MNKLYNILTIVLLSILFSGCSNLNQKVESSVENNQQINYKKYYKVYNGFNFDTEYEAMINYKLLTNDAVKEIFKNNKEIPEKIIVTDFVDISSLKNNSKIGYILSNSIKDSLINIYNANVIESEVSKYFKLSGNGLRLLTRDVNKVKTLNYNVENAVVGTYTYTEHELIVFIKLINLKTGIIKGSFTTSVLIGKSLKD